MREARLREALLDARVPDPQGAQERGWRLVRAAYLSSPPPLRPRRRIGARRALRAAVALALLGALISPAGAAVRHWVRDAVDTGHTPSSPALSSLPSPGSLLVDSARGPWVVHADGSKRLLGAFAQSSWSPHGLYVAAADEHQLAAVEPAGAVHWSLSRRGPVRDPAWSPDGYRIAYLNGAQLRMVAGDGTGDRLLEPAVASVQPAWEPGRSRRLSFVAHTGRVRTVDVDTGRAVFEAPAPADSLHLGWSADGARLLVATRTALVVLDHQGREVWRAEAPPGTDIVSAAIAPGGSRAATVLVSKSGERSELALLGPGGRRRSLFQGLGRFEEVVYSPDGEWLLLAWRSADQWLFLNPDEPRRVVAISDIAAQFDPGATSPPSFPSVAGWCCPDGG